MLNQGIKDAYEKGLNHLSNCEGVEVLHREQSAEVASGCGAGTCVLKTLSKDFISDEKMMEEVFGPSTLLVEYDSPEELLQIAEKLDGQLTVSILEMIRNYRSMLLIIEFGDQSRASNFQPISHRCGKCANPLCMGPFPATTDSLFYIRWHRCDLRFARPVCFQDFPTNGCLMN